jgi:hypothetical protein
VDPDAVAPARLWQLAETEPGSRTPQAFVTRPEPNAAQPGRGEQVNVNPPEANAGKVMTLDELARLGVGSHYGRGEPAHQPEYLLPVWQVATGQLADDERMAHDAHVVQSGRKLPAGRSEVIDPD